jgi:tetratricopeptide (TPR) repeat protein
MLLIGALSARRADQPVSGLDLSGSPAPAGQSDLAFFEQRVVDHPRDLAARLDLAARYLQAGDTRDAVPQYFAALEIEPRNAEAHANLGYVLFLSGKAAEGLKAVNQALAVSPNDPEALYYQGVILLQGLHQPREAVDALRRYLDAAPFGSRRDEVQMLLQQAGATG